MTTTIDKLLCGVLHSKTLIGRLALRKRNIVKAIDNASLGSKPYG